MMYLREMVKRCARNYPTKTAYYCGDRCATWRQMDERSDRLAVALQGMGHGKGTAVAILTLESIEVYEHFFACMKIGAVRVGINTQYAWPEARHVLKDSGAKVLMVDARCKQMADDHRTEIEALGITLIGYNGAHDFALDYENLLKSACGEPAWPALAPDDLLFYSYTSGTTGVPKGVMLTQQGAADCVIHSLISFGFAADDTWYMPAASAWVVVIMNCFNLGNGMSVVIPDGAFQIVTYLRDVERFRVTVALLVPTMIRRAIAEHESGKYDLSSLRLLMYGSSPATPKLIRDARAAFKVAMAQTYALTESTGGWVTFLTEEDHRLALESETELLKSVGRVGIHFDCSIRDDDGNPVPVNTKGEIWLRGSTVMKGYLNLPEATAEVLKDGWLRTNDIGRMDERGYIYLLDRRKFMIITGAVNVFPTTVEAVLVEHPAIQELAVVGVPHPEWGEAVVAVVVRRPTHADVAAADIIKFCHGRLGAPETPKHVVFVDDLIKTANAKVRKAEIIKWLSTEKGLVPWSTEVEA
ncbi:AMP-binding protein [Variovorax paradoxus]|uniref:class I adenylate-forming enzyme family protein n=1 Tax=Variovorax paradoxus TaxID=34073 RepID=UPI001ABC22D7